jgi:tRNA 2-selenouridine synthase
VRALRDVLLQGLDQPGSLIDVRAPTEYRKGAMPGSLNLPILTDRERHEVGLRYRQAGQDAAIALGERLTAGPRREARVDGWQRQLAACPEAALYCWRGGLRSQRAAQWLADRGLSLRPVPGGYQALRRAALDILQTYLAGVAPAVLAGRTGVGKTVVLNQTPLSIDLEGLASHRGSAFGARAAPQPAPASFENALAAQCLAHARRVAPEAGGRDTPEAGGRKTPEAGGRALLLLEDESRTIGRVALPELWYECMQQAPVVVLTATLEERVNHIVREYVEEPFATGTRVDELRKRYLDAIGRIRKRLGGQRSAQLQQAIRVGFERNEHHGWIEQLLTGYYDPMYDYQLTRKETRVCFAGTAGEIAQWLESASLDLRLLQLRDGIDRK